MASVLDLLDVQKKPDFFANLERAQREMKLTDQEVNLYQHHLKNLQGGGKVMNPDGSVSTVRQMSIDVDGQTVNVPTVWNSQVLEPDAAMKEVERVGIKNFPSYKSRAEAEKRYQQMHKYMEEDTRAYLGSKK